MEKMEKYFSVNFSELIADMDFLPIGDKIRNYLYQFKLSIDELELFVENLEDKDSKIDFYSSIDKLEEKFIKRTNNLIDIFFIANETGFEEDAKGAMLLFKGNNGKIERYLKNKVGNTRYELIKSLRTLIKETEENKVVIRGKKSVEQYLLMYIFGSIKKSDKLLGRVNKKNFFTTQELEDINNNLDTLKKNDPEKFSELINSLDREKIKQFIESGKSSFPENEPQLIKIKKQLKELSEKTNIEEFQM
jgi:hypothetical protein